MGVVVDQLNTVVVGDPLVDRLDRSESGCEADDDDDHHKVVVVDTTDSQKYTKSIIEIAGIGYNPIYPYQYAYRANPTLHSL